MIIDVKKYVILGVKEDLDRFFDRAQHKGFIEFISPAAKRSVEHPGEIQKLAAALKILRKLPVKNQLDLSLDIPGALQMAERVLELKNEVEKLSEEKRLLEAEVSRVAPFGDFSLDDIDYIEREGKQKVQFFCVKTELSHQINFADEIIYIGTEYDLDYFITFNGKAQQYPGMIEMRIDRPLGELKNHHSFVKESLHELEAELKGFAGHVDYIYEALIEFLNGHHLAIAKKEVSFPLDNSLFAVEAWIPENKAVSLYALLDGMAVHCEEIGYEESERAPTYMENRGVARIGEDLVRIYDIPATTDNDPSRWVFWFFALFFAIIVADGGYGLLYLGLGLFLKIKFPQLKGQAKRFIKMIIVLSTACVIWGVLTSAFFGMKIDPKGYLGRFSAIYYLAEKKAEYHMQLQDDVYQYWVDQYEPLKDAQTGRDFLETAIAPKTIGSGISYKMLNTFVDNILLEFSLLLGILHVSISFFRYLLRHWAGIGWIAFMIGGYLYFPTLLHATTLLHILTGIPKAFLAEFGIQLVYGGIATALFLALLQKRLKGIGEIANLVQIFADVLSYLRLYALGLAGAIMAETFNELGEAVGFAAGAFVILLGHGVNISLGIMAGMIHGLRLNFIEWYHYCFDGSGRLLRPLMRLKPKEH